MNYLLSFLIAYIMGCFTSGYILGWLIKGQDIRTMGSGNPGATNAFRVFGPKVGWLTFAMDFLKGMLAVYIGRRLGGETGSALAFLGADLGHMYPIFFKFKGGKGVATSAGCLSMISGKFLLILLAIFLVFAVISKYVSLGSLVACIAAIALAIPILGRERMLTVIVIWILASVIIYKHRSNIGRLMRGEENKFSFNVKK